MSIHNIPQDLDLLRLDIECRKILARSFTYDVNIAPTFVVFIPDLTLDEFNKLNLIIEKLSASMNLSTLPQWATWTAQEASDFVNTSIFNGGTQAQVDAQIDALPNTVAGMKTGLKQVAAVLLSIRSILMAMAKAIIYLRNLSV